MRYSRRRGRKSSDSGVAGALLSLLFLIPVASLLSRPKKKHKRKPTLDETIDKHFDK
jgi:hypothetical protein